MQRIWLLSGCFAIVAWMILGSALADQPDVRARAGRLRQDGNFAEALELYRQLCADAATDPRLVSSDLEGAVQCMAQLGDWTKWDELIEQTIATHQSNWLLLATAAQQYLNAPHHGTILDGKFFRGAHREGGRYVGVQRRDEVRGLQLMQEAMALVDREDNKSDAAQFYRRFAEMLLQRARGDEAWRFALLTDLDELPEYDEYQRGGFWPGRMWGESPGAPVDADGQPVYHRPPRTEQQRRENAPAGEHGGWSDAVSDGQRWRWAMNQAVELDPKLHAWRQMQLAEFALEQFGVQTLRQSPWWSRLAEVEPDDEDGDETPRVGTFTLHTLTDDETIARLATGPKRFTLPDDYNYIKLFREVAEAGGDYSDEAISNLAELFTDRRQYEKAAAMWKLYIERRPGSDDGAREELAQIEGNWGQIESVSDTHIVGRTELDYRFRNGNHVTIEARPVNLEKLLTDAKAYLRSSPREMNWGRFYIEQIGHRLITENQMEYVGEAVGTWEHDLTPLPAHFDRRVTLDLPIKQPGVYLVTAKMRDGNVNHVVMWVHDTVIIRKPLGDSNLYIVADAVTGQPLPNMNLEFFGFKQVVVPNTRRGQTQILTRNFATRTNQDGSSTPDASRLDREYQWMTIARGPDGRLAYLGFQGVWHGQRQDPQFDQSKILVITDRPVYRPGHKVQWKLWAAQAKYDLEDSSPFAGTPIEVTIRDPEGKEIAKSTATADAFGGVAGEVTLPANAKLGVYTVSTQLPLETGGNTFRVEEYKKPEFEVQVKGPERPIQLGETFTAAVTANYYFGAPVSEGTVHYRVLRYSHSSDWFPISPWDWCFGPGYWWFAYDTPWYPGFDQWVGCRRPQFAWFMPRPVQPPELIAEADVALKPDGTAEVKIDTALAKELLGHTDHRYEISVEVRDPSRRTIMGSGEVIASRKPFQVFTWVDRGYYRVGQRIDARFQAQTVDRRPVVASGTARLLRVTYDDQRQPVETVVSSWDVTTGEDGSARLAIQASAAGQYRLTCELVDAEGHRVEGAYLFTIIGEGFDGREFRFNDVEVIPDQREYRPGDTVRLQVNTDRAGSFVWLFVRPVGGVYQPPRLLRLDGKSTTVEIEVAKGDMPNFYVEVVTVSNGKLAQETRELFVPPEKRVVSVDVLPDQTEYLPGGKARVGIKLTDVEGQPVTGSTVVAIYDKALDYIAGPQLTPHIKEFFWKWRRHHSPARITSLDRYEPVMGPPGAPMMEPLGVFGDTVADELAANAEGMVMQSAALGGRGGRGLPSAPAPGAEARFGALKDTLFAAESDGAGGGSGSVVEPVVRTQFADTALWVATLNTDAQGMASVELQMPENLTTWKIRCWSMGAGTRVGQGEVEVITTKNLLIRLQSPRFLLTGDEVVLSANVHNYLESDKPVRVTLDVPRDMFDVRSPAEVNVNVAAGGHQRVDWRAIVLREGEAAITMSALTDEESDAMRIELPVKVRGADIQHAWAGTLPNGRPVVSLDWTVPADRRPDSAVFTFRWSPTLAGAMIDALPYLAEYPYGCTEQTLNRFLPTVVTHRTLQRLGVDLDRLARAHANLNPQQLGDAAERAAAWRRFERSAVYDADVVDSMVQEGLMHLAEQQLSDGGWGWFGGWHGSSSVHTTAVVVRGLLVAQSADVPVVPDMLTRGVDWLLRYQNSQIELLDRGSDPNRDKKLPYKASADNIDALVHHILVEAGRDNAKMREYLYRDRLKLSLYGQTLLGLAAHRTGDSAKLAMVLRNLDQFLFEDETNETAYFKLPGGFQWWYWYGSEPELHAMYLKLLTKVEPRGQRAQRVVKYLLNNRQHGIYWRSTRDTALCVEAMADYLQATGELGNRMIVELWVDGQRKQQIDVTPENMLDLPNTLTIAGDELGSGEHRIELRRDGAGPVYYNAYMSYFSLEEKFPAAGLEVQIARNYYRLTPDTSESAVAGQRGQPVAQQRLKYHRERIEEGTQLNSGDLIEVELNVTSKNDYEYLIVRDPRAAGCETVEVRSGYQGNGLGAYAEFHDDHAAFFIQNMARGTHTLTYQVRAEVPGRFTALPASVAGMYAPELKGNSTDQWLVIEDSPTTSP